MQPGSKILPLTAVRFFAAFYVVLFHTVYEVGSGCKIGEFLQLGQISVSFFFTLSGFILALVYLEKGVPLNKRRFWVARFARIFPLYAATLLLAVPPVLGGMVRRSGLGSALLQIGKLLLTNCFMMQAWNVRLRGLDNPNWSVAVEVFFYLLFPLFALLLNRRHKRALCLIAITSYCFGLLLVWLGLRLNTPLDELKFNPILHIHEFVMGICGGLLIMRSNEEGRELLRKSSNFLMVGSIVTFSVFLYLFPRIPFLLIHDGLLTPLFMAVILALYAGKGFLQRVLSHPLLVLLGEASFGLYLIHIPVWIILKFLPYGHSWPVYPIYLAFVVVLSIISFYFLEGPSRSYILRTFATRSRETTVEASVLQ